MGLSLTFTLCMMLPVLGWYLYTITEPARVRADSGPARSPHAAIGTQ